MKFIAAIMLSTAAFAVEGRLRRKLQDEHAEMPTQEGYELKTSAEFEADAEDEAKGEECRIFCLI